MEVYRHFLITIAASLGLLTLSGYQDPQILVLATAYAVAVGVFMDLDHFLLAWSGSGDLIELKKALRNPLDAFTDAEKIFERGVFTTRARFLSHITILYITTGLSFLAGAELAVFTATIVSLHIAADIYVHLKTHGLPAVSPGLRSSRKHPEDPLRA